MPELPEVEHVRKKLDRWMRGRRIVALTAIDPRIVRPATPEAFAAAVVGRTVASVDRRGKWLRLLLDDGQRLFSHLGMTGWFEQGEGRRFERVAFELSGTPRQPGSTSHVAYVDARRWGRIWLAAEDVASWTALGPDPLTDGIDAVRLAARLARRKRRSIKEALMDQALLAGVGNIQAIEALWKAQIDPRSSAAAVAAERALVRRIVSGLRWTIARTLEDLEKDEDGPSPFRIYGRKGTPCPRCKTTLERITLGGRTTTFCPGCQRRITLRGARRAAGRGSSGKRRP